MLASIQSRIAVLSKRAVNGIIPAAELHALQRQHSAMEFMRNVQSPAVLRLVPPRISGYDLSLVIPKVVAALARSSAAGENPLTFIDEHDRHTRAALSVLTRAAQAPASTNEPAWAQTLVRMAWEQFQQSLARQSALVRLIGGTPFKLGDSLPSRAPRDAASNSLSGAFRAEGDTIRIGAAALRKQKFDTYNVGVIFSFTNEVLQATNLPALAEELVIEDTATMLDRIAFSAAAALPGVAPAGLMNGAATEDRLDATNTADGLQWAIGEALKRQVGQDMDGRRSVWVIPRAISIGMGATLGTSGLPMWPEMAAPTTGTRTLHRLPVVEVDTLDATSIFLVNRASLAIDITRPVFARTNEATIAESDDAPGPIDAPGAPVRSLYQTNSAAARMVMKANWLGLRPGAVVEVFNAKY